MNRSSLNRALMASAIFLGVWSMASAVNSFRLDAAFVEPASNVTLTFNLDNDQEFYGFQADFHFPEGMEVDLVNGKADVKLSSRADNSYTVVSNLISTGDLRIGAFSATHTPFSGEEGTLVCINVSTSEDFKGGQLSVTEILFSDAYDKDVKIPDYKVTLRNAPDNKFTIPAISFNTGERGTVEAILKNEVPFTAFQFDLYLPEELKVEDHSWSLTSRATESHTLSVRSNENGVTRFLCFSPDSAPILGEDGAVLKFNLESQEDIIAETFTMKLRNLVFSAPDGREYLLGDSDTEVSVSRAVIVESIVIEPTSWSAMQGDTLRLTAKVYPEDALDKSLTWTSDNEAVATVDEEGVVTALAIGETVIRVAAAANPEIFAECKVTVEKALVPLESLTLSETEMTLKPGQEAQLSVTLNPEDADNVQLAWSSSDEKVVTVDEEGNIAAIAVGEAVIRVADAANPDIFAECKVTVEKVLVPLVGLTLSETELTLNPGDNAQLTVTLDPEDADNVQLVWASSDEDAATVDEDGNVTALAVGEAVIRVSAAANPEIFAECKLTVEKASVMIEAILLSEGELTLKPGEMKQLVATVLPEEADAEEVVWRSSNDDVAIVDEDGLVKALAIGEAIIRAESIYYESIFAECHVKVNIETGVSVISNKVYSIKPEGRSIYVSGLTAPSEIALYSMDGVLLRHEICKDSSLKIEIPLNGIYLLVIDGIMYKVLVK